MKKKKKVASNRFCHKSLRFGLSKPRPRQVKVTNDNRIVSIEWQKRRRFVDFWAGPGLVTNSILVSGVAFWFLDANSTQLSSSINTLALTTRLDTLRLSISLLARGTYNRLPSRKSSITRNDSPPSSRHRPPAGPLILPFAQEGCLLTTGLKH